MSARLLIKALIRMILGFAVMAALLFLPAGSFGYWQAWLLLGILFGPMLIAGIVLAVKKPELLERRLNMREEQKEQRFVVAMSGLIFILAFVAAGLSYRNGWLMFPAWASYESAVVFLLSYGLYAEVLRENIYLSRTIEVQADQKVIDTGLYGIVRHPMYMSTVILFMSMPLVLGSPLAFLIMLLYVPVIVMRIRNEEKVLEKGLPGYTEYEKKVKHRLIPFIW
ncbi:MAG: isoprenylcysteine carboxylmethyltransferase family protein [Eubacterium sp.]|nr:isoprenylcysteine carboxylmethyltransferase family protein [Eubacterium sp.]